MLNRLTGIRKIPILNTSEESYAEVFLRAAIAILLNDDPVVTMLHYFVIYCLNLEIILALLMFLLFRLFKQTVSQGVSVVEGSNITAATSSLCSKKSFSKDVISP